MHSFKQVESNRLGFTDKDRGNSRHDWACQYLSTGCRGFHIVRAIVPKVTPWDSSFSNSKVRRHCEDLTWYRPWHEWEIYPHQGFGQRTKPRLAGFADLVIPYQAVWRSEWDDDQETDRKPTEQSGRVLVEVKIGPVPIGDILRQVKFYRSTILGHDEWGNGWGVSSSYRWDFAVVTAYPLQAEDRKVLTDHKLHHFQLGQQFEDYCATRKEEVPVNEALEI